MIYINCLIVLTFTSCSYLLITARWKQSITLSGSLIEGGSGNLSPLIVYYICTTHGGSGGSWFFKYDKVLLLIMMDWFYPSQVWIGCALVGLNESQWVYLCVNFYCIVYAHLFALKWFSRIFQTWIHRKKSIFNKPLLGP